MLVQEGRNLCIVPCCTVSTQEVLCVCRKNEVGLPTPIRGLPEASFEGSQINWPIPWNVKNVRTTHRCSNKQTNKQTNPSIPWNHYLWAGYSQARVSILHEVRIPSLDLPASGNSQHELWLGIETPLLHPRLPKEGSWGFLLLVPSQEALKCHLNSSDVGSWFWDMSSPSPQVANLLNKANFPFPTKKKKKKQRS